MVRNAAWGLLRKNAGSDSRFFTFCFAVRAVRSIFAALNSFSTHHALAPMSPIVGLSATKVRVHRVRN